MPYVPTPDRPELNPLIMKLGDQIASMLIPAIPDGTDPNKAAVPEISVIYRDVFLDIALKLRENQENRPRFRKEKNLAEDLADGIFEVAKKYGYDSAWAGELNYAATVLIQDVPLAMVERKAWNTDLRYWLYSGTVGALTRTALGIDAIARDPNARNHRDDWITDQLVGVFTDVVDEYKRRVNPAYEIAQILRNGDCYGGSYHTSLIEVQGLDPEGNSVSAWIDATLTDGGGGVLKHNILLPRERLWKERAEGSLAS